MTKTIPDHQMMSLTQYIKTFYNGVNAEFARKQGVKPQQVTQWITKSYVVKDHKLYSPRRELA